MKGSRADPSVPQHAGLPLTVLVLLVLLLLPRVTAAGLPVADRYQAEVATLAKHPKVARALRSIVAQEQQLLREMITLTEIPAPPFEEGPRATYFATMLKAAGVADVSLDEVGNAIAKVPGRGAGRIVVAAHIDTVFPAETDVTVSIEDNVYRAPGIGDNTRGLVSMLAVLRAIKAADIELQSEVWFVGDVGEEGLGDLRGVKHLFRPDAPTIDALIAIDGGAQNRLIYGAVGSHRYRVTFRGDGGHSWGAFGRVQPHHAMGRVIAHLVDLAGDVTRTGAKTTYNIGRMGGGTSINSIPFESWAEIDLRSGDQNKLNQIDSVFRQAVARALAEENAKRDGGNPLTVEIDRVGTRPAGRGDVNGALVQRAAAAMRTLGEEPRLGISSTDANVPISLGIPAITLSRGGISRNAHAPHESWENVESHIGPQTVLLTLLAQAGMLVD